MQEKRRHPRVSIDVNVRCEISGRPPVDGKVVDVSVGGIYIEAPAAPAFGTQVTIVGDFPGGPGLKLPAVVRWTKPGGFGAQFGLLGAKETHVLSAIVQRARS